MDQFLSHIREGNGKKRSGQSRHPLKDFIAELFLHSPPRYVTFSFPVDAIDPLAYLEMCWKNNSFQYYWEKPSDEFAIAAGGTLHTISASGAGRFQEVNTKIKAAEEATAEYSTIAHPYSGLMFLGGFSFFDHITGEHWDSFQPASLTIPKWTIIKEGKFHLLTVAVDLADFTQPKHLYEHITDRLSKTEQTIQLHSSKYPVNGSSYTIDSALPLSQKSQSDYSHWIASVTQARKLIRNQTFNKIVLARELTISSNSGFAPAQFINSLRSRYYSCYNFLIHQPQNKTFLGSTPERLGSFRKNMLLTEALAGSMKRGQSATEDSFLAKDLSASKKNLNEHNFVIKDIEERLHRYAQIISRRDQPEVKKLSNIQHLFTPIRARLNNGVDPMTIVEQLHPTPAVGGYPWEDAAPYLKELENFERGWYAGPVGWLNTGGCGEFAVGIRSGLLTEDKAHFFAGCGIVADSDPIAEWEETNLKLNPMLSALQYD